MLDKYVFGANAILLVYDVSNFKSFERLHEWLIACKALLAGASTGVTMARPPAFAIVANKIDLEHLRTVKAEQHHRFAQVHQ
jgi:Ras-related protein Rab-28